MVGRITLIVSYIVVLAGLLALPALAVESAPGEMVVFCTAGGSQEHPDIDGDMVVWEDGRNGNRGIYSSSEPGPGARITDETASEERPSISGDYIVWQENRDGNWDIYLYRRSTGEETQLTTDPGNQWLPIVRGNRVAWYDDSSGRTNVVLYDITAKAVKTSIDADAKTTIPYGSTGFAPALSDRYLGWVKGGDDRIWYYEIDTGETGPASPGGGPQSWPSLSGSRIAWEDYRNGDPDIYLADLGDPSGEVEQITDNPAWQVSPALSEEIIVWEDTRDGVSNIYIRDFSPGEAVQMPLAPSDIEQLYPAVSGNRIIWQEGRGGKSDLYLFTYAGGTPPVAQFSTNTTEGIVPLPVRFTDRSTGNPVSWEWKFGDGGSSKERNPVYTYESPGEYTVSLTVSNRFGSDTVTKVDPVRVESPELPAADFSAVPVSGGAPLVVKFTDGSSNSPTAWFWDFGDGATSDEQNPFHTYAEAGTYTVSLTADNAAGSANVTKHDYITIIKPPSASFEVDARNGTPPHTVRFSDTSTGDIKARSWRFGDGGFLL